MYKIYYSFVEKIVIKNKFATNLLYLYDTRLGLEPRWRSCLIIHKYSYYFYIIKNILLILAEKYQK